jgi:Flp pilus assembly pilin Flp
MKRFAALLRDESGAALVQYALVSALMSVAMMAALAAIAAECATRLSVTSSGMTTIGTNPP